MKFPKINNLTPQGEPFDETAVGEGIWLSAGHVQAIENGLAASDNLVSEKDSSINTLTEKVTALQNLADVSEQTAEDLRAMNQKQETEIKELKAEVAALGEQPSGNGSNVPPAGQETTEATPSYLSVENPINAWVDSKFKRKTA